MPESKHARKLCELGFKKIDKDLTVAVRAATLPDDLSRQQKRQLLRRMRYLPWFSMSAAITYATDETGQSWHGPANTDLSGLGFDNRSEHNKAMLEKLRNPDVTHH